MKQTKETTGPKLRVLWTRKDVAKMLGCSLRMVDLLREKEGLPSLKIGALVRIDEEQFLKWLESRKTVQEVG